MHENVRRGCTVGARVQRKSLNLTDANGVARGKEGADINSGIRTNALAEKGRRRGRRSLAERRFATWNAPIESILVLEN